MKKAKRIFIIGFSVLTVAGLTLPARAGKAKNPTVEEAADGTRILILPEDVEAALAGEFKTHRVPAESEFNPNMLKYFFSNLIGIHPAVAWGDFNGDKKRDYAVLVVTGDSPWGPLVELVVLSADKKGYEVIRVGEVYNFKDDYVSFRDGKLTKGKYQKGAWYINWDPRKSIYVTTKS